MTRSLTLVRKGWRPFLSNDPKGCPAAASIVKCYQLLTWELVARVRVTLTMLPKSGSRFW